MVLFFSPPPREGKKDGYFARVHEVDQIFGQQNRVYVEVTGRFDHFDLKQIGAKTWHLKIHRDYANTEDFWRLINQFSSLIYFHSIYNFAEISPTAALISPDKTIIDLHGAVPEELTDIGNPSLAKDFSEIEKKALKKIRKVIVVSLRMQKHIQSKYPDLPKTDFLLLPTLKSPHLNVERNQTLIDRKKMKMSTPTLAYVGGMQKWQKVDKMIDVIKSNSQFDFKIYSAEADSFRNLLGSLSQVSHCGFVSEDQLRNEYEKIHYSLILRDSHVLNEVSCPTKMIDTIFNLAVPILDSPHIGDFNDMGLKFISVDEVKSIAGLSPEVFEDFLKTNLEILRKMGESYIFGRKQLLSLLDQSRDFDQLSFKREIKKIASAQLSKTELFTSEFFKRRGISQISILLAKMKIKC